MSTELAITISFGALATAIGGVQIWQGRKRSERSTPAPSANPTSQPLREEAATALLDAYMNLTRFEPEDHRALWAGMKELETPRGDLEKLWIRLGIAQGIGEQERAAFTEAFERVIALSEATAVFYGRRFDLEDSPEADQGLDEELEAVARAEEAFQASFARFERAAREAAMGVVGPTAD